MDIEDAIYVVSNINDFSDDELLSIYENVYNTLIDNFYFTMADNFIALLIRKIKSLSKKSYLINKYFASPLNPSFLFKSLELLSFDEKKLILKDFFQNNSFEEIKNNLNIPSNLKMGFELEYTKLSSNFLESLFNSDNVDALLDVLGVSKNIINEIVTKTAFKKNYLFDKWVISEEMCNENYPELSSPILNNRVTDFNVLKAYHFMFDNLGAEVSDETAFQINVGVDYFNGDTNCLKYLLVIWGECEELFYKISNKENTIIRSLASDMAKPIKGNIQMTLNENDNIKLDNEEDFYRFLYNIQVRDDLNLLLKIPFIEDCVEYSKFLEAETNDEKYEIFRNMFNYSKRDIWGRIKFKSINFTHMNWHKNNKGRIEFRIFNNIMDFDDLLLNIYLIGRLMFICKELANGNEMLLNKYNMLLNKEVNEEEKIDLLLNLLFDDDKKEVFKRRWESVKDNSAYNKYYTGEATFIRESNKKLKKTIF